MHFQRVFYRYVTTPAGPATVAMGADSAPTTAYGTPGTAPVPQPPAKSAANVDNVISCRNWGSAAPAPVNQIAVAMCGPSGATAPTANLYVWDDNTQHWYLLTATAVTLTDNEVILIPVAALAENLAQGGPQSASQTSNNGADYMLVVVAPGSPTAGQYSFAMSAVLSAPAA
jgi:hypothetical protein